LRLVFGQSRIWLNFFPCYNAASLLIFALYTNSALIFR
jgi:hypothetical protein